MIVMIIMIVTVSAATDAGGVSLPLIVVPRFSRRPHVCSRGKHVMHTAPSSLYHNKLSLEKKPLRNTPSSATKTIVRNIVIGCSIVDVRTAQPQPPLLRFSHSNLSAKAFHPPSLGSFHTTSASPRSCGRSDGHKQTTTNVVQQKQWWRRHKQRRGEEEREEKMKLLCCV